MRWLLLVGLALSVTACVEPVPNDDLVPEYIIPKTVFEADNDWWMSRTVIGAPYNVSFTYIGDGDYPDRVRWTIEEEYLIAYRAHPQVFGLDDDVAGLNDYEAPAAIYPIKRHLDVVEGQLLSAPKRPWYERGFIEVDWAREASGSFRFQLNRVDSVPRETPAYYISDPADEDHPVFDNEYIDFTTHLTIKPTEQDSTTTPRLSPCDGRVSDTIIDLVDCSPSNIAFRTAFKQIPSDYEYEPIQYRQGGPGNQDQIWGSRVFRMGRLAIDEQYANRDQGFHILPSRFNIWERSFDDSGEPLPFDERVVKPVVWHIGPDFPSDMLPEMQAAMAQWNDVLRDTVREARAWACIDKGGDEAACRADAVAPDDVLLLCANYPVAADDPAACGPPGQKPRLGDTRMNMIRWETTPNALWGLALGWWTPDPATGESFSSYVVINPAGIDRASATFRDLVLLAQGRLGREEYIEGANIDQWLADIENFSINPFAALVETPSSVNPTVTVPTPTYQPAQTLSPLNMSSSSTATYGEALAPFRGTNVESMIIDEEALLMADINPMDPRMPDDVMDRASPVRRAYHQAADTPRGRAETRLREIGIDLDLPVSIDLFQMAAQMADADPDEIYQTIRRRYGYWVFLHEFGHVLGMTHNFSASYDALNYPPQYWALRGNDATNGPRYVDPLTPEEIDGGIHELAYASVMDYFSAPTNAPGELGHFDVAAMRWLYGGLIEVFEEPPATDAARDYLEATWKLNRILGVPTLVDDAQTPDNHEHRGVHYSKIPTVLGDTSARAYVPKDRMVEGLDSGLDIVDDQGRVAVPYLHCSDETLGIRTFCVRYDQGADPYEVVTHSINRFRSNYPLNNFRRGRLDFRQDEYVQEMWASVFDPMRNWLGHYLHYREEFEDSAFLDPDYLGPNEEAVREMFRFLTGLLVLPEAGDYYTVPNVGPEGDVLIPVSVFMGEVNPFHETIHTAVAELPLGTPEVTVPVGAGRFYRSRIATIGGTFVVNNVGSAVDKELALETLLAPEFWFFPGRNTWPDARIWSVNFSRIFEDELLDVLGSIVAGDIDRIAPRLDNGVIHTRDFLNMDEALTGQLMDPAFGFNLRLRTLVFGLALHFGQNPDRTFFDYSRIIIDGSSEDYASPRVPVLFTHPDTLETFKAYRYDESGRELGIGARLLDRANVLNDAAQGLGGENLEVQEHAAEMLRDQIDVIDAMRAVVATYYNNAFDPGATTEGGRPDYEGP